MGLAPSLELQVQEVALIPERPLQRGLPALLYLNISLCWQFL